MLNFTECEYMYMEDIENKYKKIKVNIKKTIKIEEIVYEDDKNKNPNILIYGIGEGDEGEIEIINIMSSVRWMITDYETMCRYIKRNKVEDIPKNIENIVVYNKTPYFEEVKKYKNTGKRIEYVDFMDKEEIDEMIEEMIENREINECNTRGESVLMKACMIKNDNIEYLIERTDKEIKYKIGENGDNFLFWLFYNKSNMELGYKIIMEDENREEIDRLLNTIIYMNGGRVIILDCVISRGYRDISLEIVKRMRPELIRDFCDRSKIYMNRYSGETIKYCAELYGMTEIKEIIDKII